MQAEMERLAKDLPPTRRCPGPNTLPLIAKQALNIWLGQNWTYPYMDAECRQAFADAYGITSQQVQRYLINSRNRILGRRKYGKNQMYVCMPVCSNGDTVPLILPAWMGGSVKKT